MNNNRIREFEHFYRRTVKPLFRYFNRLGVRARPVVEDLVQETYCEAWRSYGSLNHPEAALYWLFTIGRRRWIVQLKRQRVDRCHEASEADPLDLLQQLVDSSAVNPESCASQLHWVREIMAASRAIPDETRRKIVEAFFFEGYSTSELSRLHGVEVSTITTWLSRFRSSLRKRKTQLEQEGDVGQQFSRIGLR